MKVACANLRPDELLYSLIARSRRRLGLSTLRISKMIFGKFFIAYPLFSPRFGSVTRHLNAAAGSSENVNDLLQSSTMFKPASLGLPDINLDAVEVERIRSENPLMARQVNRALSVPHGFMLRACPFCIDDDRKQYGEAHWHRMHQFPGLKICSRHHTSLWSTDVSVIPKSYVSLDEAKLTAATAFPTAAADFQKLLAADLESLISSSGQLPSRQQIRSCYIKIANRSNTSPVTVKNIGDRIGGHFSCGMLESIDPLFANMEWGTMIFGSHRKRVLPIYAVFVAARSLGITLAQFITQSLLTKPDAAPWPCKNPACAHFDKPVIEIRHFRDRGDRAEFLCPHCNEGYLRPTPLEKSDDGSFQYTLMPKRNPNFLRYQKAHRCLVEAHMRGEPLADGQLRYAKTWLRWHDANWIEARFATQRPTGRRKLLNWPKLDQDFLAAASSIIPSQIESLRQRHLRSIKRKMLLDLVSQHLNRPFPIHALQRLPKTVAYVDTFVEKPLDVLPRRIERGLATARKCNHLPSLYKFRLMCGINVGDHQAYASPTAEAYAKLKASWSN